MPAAPPSDLAPRPYRGRVWRIVEGQHVVSTLKLVDTLAEQAALEAILEETKPPVPEECRGLHYLMYTPFRYGLYPVDSRFRRRGRTPGVFYASESALTAAAETVWSRHRFYAASPGTPLPREAAAFSAIACRVATPVAVDLTVPPLSAGASAWTDPDDYTACLAFADLARAEGAEAIRYTSVRDPGQGANLAVLTCRAFAKPAPESVETWRILLRREGAQVVREFPRLAVDWRLGLTRLVAV